MANPVDPDKADKVKRALDLREQGYSYRRIGQEIGKSHTCVKMWLDEVDEAEGNVAMYELVVERMNRLMRLEIFSDWLIDEYKLCLEQGVKKGPAATYVPLLMQVEDRRARATGTDAATKVDVNGSAMVDARAVWEAVQEARRNLGEAGA